MYRRPMKARHLGCVLSLLGLSCAANEGATAFVSDSGAGLDRAAPSADRGSLTDRGAPIDLGPSLDSGAGPDGGVDVVSVYDTGSAPSADACAGGNACAPRPESCGPREQCNNGVDDNCNGVIDENCPCLPGTVQDCFLGPPGRRSVGQCSGGSQRCMGSGEFGTWGACEGALGPGPETCDALDNNCDGCVDEGLCCRAELSCPGPGDPRIADGQPFMAYALRGRTFFTGEARSWRWQIRGGPCEALLPRPTFETFQLDSRDAAFRPTLSGDYTITLTVVTAAGQTLTCTFVVHIEGPGMRVELCWDTSTTVDLDLYVHDPRNTRPWFSSTQGPLLSVTNDSCNWSNCEANLRGAMGRVDWGYSPSPLANCENGPLGAGWRREGRCSNPRLDIDNNLFKAIGVPENMNVDAPRNGERFRIMVQNFTGAAARPLVNVYCGGRLRATVGAAPDTLPDFTGPSGNTAIGAMWRVADIVTQVDAMGQTTGCEVTPLRPPGMNRGYWVTRNDPQY